MEIERTSTDNIYTNVDEGSVFPLFVRYSDKNRNTTVFTGIFPVSAPQYIIMIMLDEPQGTVESGGWKTAAWNAVPTAGAILDGIIPLLFE